MSFQETKTELFSILFKQEWNGKQVWEHIRDENLTAVPCMVGHEFEDAKKKIMVVGRAVNGWQVPFSDCSTLDATVKSVLTQPGRLDDFANEYVIDDVTGAKYFYMKSPFLRLMKNIVNKAEGSVQDWQQKIAWSNLYCVAPRNGKNPLRRMIRPNLQTYIDIVDRDITSLQPDIVVFATDIDFFDPYPESSTYPSFFSLMAEINSNSVTLPQYICAAGRYKRNTETKLIVCQRPEQRPVDTIVNNIFEAVEAL